MLATGSMKWDRDFTPTALPWNQTFKRVKVIWREKTFTFRGLNQKLQCVTGLVPALHRNIGMLHC